jgi:septum formation protein
MKEQSGELILASASPRRRELLAQLDLKFSVAPADIDEAVLSGESPRDYVIRMAREKALAGLGDAGAGVCVLGADTAVVRDGQILGKPRDREHALEMLMLLSDGTHQVLSGVAVTDGDCMLEELSETDVSFCAISLAEAEAYWDTGEPADKAGAYAIQGRAAEFVRHIAGSYSGVVGLPLFETTKLLRAFGFVKVIGDHAAT